MSDEHALPLKQLAIYAAQNSIKGSSFKRNSLLKPLDIILQELEQCHNPDDVKGELATIQAATKELIFAYLERIARGDYAPGKTKQSKVNDYVDLFFKDVLKVDRPGNVNRLLAREKLIRAAYLFWVREALAEIFVARGKAKDRASATDTLADEDDNDTAIDEE